jgi:hypothetical protein
MKEDIKAENDRNNPDNDRYFVKCGRKIQIKRYNGKVPYVPDSSHKNPH